MKNKIIIFDMDGVLFDTTKIAQEHLFASFPGLTEEIQKELLVGNFHEEIKNLKIKRIEEDDEAMENRKRIYAEKKADALMYTGTREMLFTLHKEGFVLILNTSAYERNCFPLLEKSEVKDLFDFLGTAEISKSKVEKFNLIKDKYQADLKDMLFITDTLGDIREADIAGVPTVAVTWGAHNENYFNREPHENLLKIIFSVEELEDFIVNY